MIVKSRAALLLLSTSVLIQSVRPVIADDFGFYAGMGLGKSRVEDSFGSLSFNATDTALNLFGGYQFNRNLAVELSYIDLGAPQDTVSGLTVSVEATALQGSIMAIAPFTEQFGGYLRAGVVGWDSIITATNGSGTSSVKDDGTDFSWGAGLELIQGLYKFRLEYQGADIEGTDYSLISVSVAFSFS